MSWLLEAILEKPKRYLTWIYFVGNFLSSWLWVYKLHFWWDSNCDKIPPKKLCVNFSGVVVKGKLQSSNSWWFKFWKKFLKTFEFARISTKSTFTSPPHCRMTGISYKNMNSGTLKWGRHPLKWAKAHCSMLFFCPLIYAFFCPFRRTLNKSANKKRSTGIRIT